MASSPIKSANASMATKDAMFLFDLFRESPTPILIQIGPYAAKTGAKPNTIIKRLAGIKARNGLNISTTLGHYPRPSGANDGKTGTASKKDVKKEQHCVSEAHGAVQVKYTDIEAGYVAESGFGPEPWNEKALPTPAASPSSSAASSQRFYHYPPIQSGQQYHPALASVDMGLSHPKRTFQQTLELESEETNVDGTPWKKVKAE